MLLLDVRAHEIDTMGHILTAADQLKGGQTTQKRVRQLARDAKRFRDLVQNNEVFDEVMTRSAAFGILARAALEGEEVVNDVQIRAAQCYLRESREDGHNEATLEQKQANVNSIITGGDNDE